MLHHQTPVNTRQTALTAGFVGYDAQGAETAEGLLLALGAVDHSSPRHVHLEEL